MPTNSPPESRAAFRASFILRARLSLSDWRSLCFGESSCLLCLRDGMSMVCVEHASVRALCGLSEGHVPRMTKE
jgi:hypothetical protein